MAKAVVVYESKYGNTKLVAQTIIDEMREAGGIETVLSELKEVNLEDIVDYDVILIGSPNHWGDQPVASGNLSTSLANSL